MGADPPLLHQARSGLFELYRREFRLIWLRAKGTSMRPTIRSGNWVQVQFGAVPRGGEIVLFRTENATVAHRVIAIDRDMLLVKGDAAATFDPPLPSKDVLGVVRAIRRVPTSRQRTIGCSGTSASLAALLSGIQGRATGRLAAVRDRR